jgi:hypothetical protein
MTEQNIVLKFNGDDMFETDANIYVCTYMKIKSLIYNNNQEYYEISYLYSFQPGTLTDITRINELKRKMHPFYGCSKDIDTNGVIVYKNELIDTFIKYLDMTDEELSIYSGSTTPSHYRRKIITSLGNFWD